MTLVAILAVAGFMPLLTRVLPGASSEERSGLCEYRTRRRHRRSGRGRRCRGAAAAEPRPECSRHWLARGTVGRRGGGHGHAVRDQRGVAGRPPRRPLAAGQRRGQRVTARRCPGDAVPRRGRRRCRIRRRSLDPHRCGWPRSWSRFSLEVLLLVRATPGFRFRPGWIWLSRLRRRWPWDHIATVAGPGTLLCDADSRLSALPARPSWHTWPWRR